MIKQANQKKRKVCLLLENKTMIIYHRNTDRKRHYEKDNGDNERTDVIVKIGNKWKIKGKKVKYWNASYDTKADAQAALRAYWANKQEAKRARISSRYERHRRSCNEGFLSDFGKNGCVTFSTISSRYSGTRSISIEQRTKKQVCFIMVNALRTAYMMTCTRKSSYTQRMKRLHRESSTIRASSR